MLHLLNRDSVPVWFDVILIFFFAWNGLILGFTSIYLVQQVVAERIGPVTGWTTVVGVMGLSSYGIYIGRFLRWNSWDVVRNPLALLGELGHELVHPFNEPRMIAVTGLLSMFLMLAYLMLIGLMHLHRITDRRELAPTEV